MVEAEVADGVALEAFGCALEEVYCCNAVAVVDTSGGDGAAAVVVVELSEEVCAAAEVGGNCHREHGQEDTGISPAAEVSLNFAIMHM